MKTALLESLLQLLIISPLLFLGFRKNPTAPKKFLLYFVGIFVLCTLAVAAGSSTVFFQGQQWNWAGKGLALLLEAGLVAFLVKKEQLSSGIRFRFDWSGSRNLLLVCCSYFILRILLYTVSGEANWNIHPETSLFQASLPGIQEELLFRGLLLALLNSVFLVPKFRILGTDAGLGVLISSLLFGLVHGCTLSAQNSLQLNYFMFAQTCFDGLLFALLAQKTKSIVPGIVFHNLLNLIGQH